jgi:hypothetical protein
MKPVTDLQSVLLTVKADGIYELEQRIVLYYSYVKKKSYKCKYPGI